jgi:hypothetical protein
VPYMLTVNGEAFPFDLDAVTASQVIGLRANLGVTQEDLQAVAFDPASPVELPTVVALMVISAQQRGLPADAGWFGERVTLTSDVEISTGPTPQEVAAAAAVLASA